MTTRFLLALAAILLLLLPVRSQVFEGILEVTSVTPGCAAGTIVYGSTYRFTYRHAVSGELSRDALVFFYDRLDGPVAKRYTPLAGVSLNGSVSAQYERFGVNGGVNFFSASSNLTI